MTSVLANVNIPARDPETWGPIFVSARREV
jgi:hypothetical protein